MMRFLPLLLLSLLSSVSFGEVFTLVSPDRATKLRVENKAPLLVYELEYRGRTILHSSQIALQLKAFEKEEWKYHSSSPVQYKENKWMAAWGQKIDVSDPCQKGSFHFKNEKLGTLSVDFALFNRAMAFRMVLNGTELLKDGVIQHEKSQINIGNEGTAWWAWADYNTQEQVFQETPLKDATWVNTPFTTRLPSGVHVAVHEASLVNYSRMTLKRDANGVFATDLVPWKNGDLVRFHRKVTTPWRVVLFGDHAGELLESSVIKTLNEPCKIPDTRWIKPISYVGIWWEMHQGTHTWTDGPRHAATTERAKQIINFAAYNRIGGVLVEGWNTGWDRWGQDSVFDQTTSAKDYDLKEVARYAQMKGVALIAHCETGGDAPFFEARLDAAFSLYRKFGIRYVKTGYAGAARPIGEHLFGQGMVQHYQKVVEKAAQYGLMLDVHECIQPTGLERTWPNLMTGESVRGMEWEAWSAGNSPDHTVLLPFTRGLAGPMDYTAGMADVLFKNRGNYTPWNGQEQPGMQCRVHSTVVHQMALMGVLYSPMQMAADRFENYQKSAEWQQFFRLFSTEVAESKVLVADVGKTVVVARKFYNGVWMVSAVNGTQAREVEWNWDFLGWDSVKAFVFTDLGDWQNQPDQFQLTGEKINSPTEHVKLPAGGGKVWFLIPEGPKIPWD